MIGRMDGVRFLFTVFTQVIVRTVAEGREAERRGGRGREGRREVERNRGREREGRREGGKVRGMREGGESDRGMREKEGKRDERRKGGKERGKVNQRCLIVFILSLSVLFAPSLLG